MRANINNRLKQLRSLLAVLLFVFFMSSPTVLAIGSYTWTASGGATPVFCYNLSSSQDGKYVLCANYGGDLLTSSDYGNTWVDQAGSGVHDWYGSGVSSTGQYMVAVDSTGYLYKSSDFGVTWLPLTTVGPNNWGNATISANGQVITANAQNTEYTSTNGGNA